jgi:hypothetical protein
MPDLGHHRDETPTDVPFLPVEACGRRPIYRQVLSLICSITTMLATATMPPTRRTSPHHAPRTSTAPATEHEAEQSYAPGAPLNKQEDTSFIPNVEAFNKKIKMLTLDMYARFKTDPMVDRAKKRVMACIDIDPIYIIDLVGAYLYSYRDQIYDRKATFFINQDYDKEFRESVDPSKVDAVKYIMPKIKSAWGGLDDKARAQYENCVIGMLDDYIEYLSKKLLKKNTTA